MAKAEATSKEARLQSSGWLVGSLSGGHAVVHWYMSGFFVVLAEIRRDLGLTGVQLGALPGVTFFINGVVSLLAGFMTEVLPRSWPLLLATTLGGIGLAYLLAGLSPVYAVLLVAVGLMGFCNAFWHPPALAAISESMPKKKALGIAIHGSGGSTGDTLGPISLGLLVGTLAWRGALQVSAIAAFLITVGGWWYLRNLRGQGSAKLSSGSYLRALRGLASNIPVLLLLLLAGFRGMGQIVINSFLAVYLREDAGFSPALVGLHLSLLNLLGIASQPVLGSLSDRFGRLRVLLPGFLFMGVMAALLPLVGTGALLTVNIALLGVCIFALSPIIIAFATDLTPPNIRATTMGFIFAANFVFAGVSTVLAGIVVDAYETKAAFYFAAGVYATASILTVALAIMRGSIRRLRETYVR